MVEVVCEDCGERQRIGIFDAADCARCGSDRLRAIGESGGSGGSGTSDGPGESDRDESDEE